MVRSPERATPTRSATLIDPVFRQWIRRRLLYWYDAHGRDLPWRRRAHDPYAQLLAEFMLQQTQVTTVIEYYLRFIRRFPTVRALAAADRDEVLSLWSGLGYYRRARHLHTAARQIMEDYGGRVPAEVDELMKLSGIGRYTAGAIASIAYGVRAPVLDGNVIRVLMRLLAMPEDPKSPDTRSRLWGVAEELLPRRRCGDFNQALMDLGATRCAPKSPECPHCPLHARCSAFARGLTDRIPQPAKRTRILAARMVVLAVRRGDRLLFVQRPDQGLWAGLWELPSEAVGCGEKISVALTRLRARIGLTSRLRPRCTGQLSHLLTHRRISFSLYCLTIRDQERLRPLDGQVCRWVRPDRLGGLGVSKACRSLLKLLDGDV